MKYESVKCAPFGNADTPKMQEHYLQLPLPTLFHSMIPHGFTHPL